MTPEGGKFSIMKMLNGVYTKVRASNGRSQTREASGSHPYQSAMVAEYSAASTIQNEQLFGLTDHALPTFLAGSTSKRITDCRFCCLIKRAMDIIVGFTGLIFSIPLLVLISLLIRLESRGPVIFRQKRPGKNGKSFDIYKFRTMFNGSGDLLDQLTKEHLAEYNQYGKIADDPRVTRIGWLLRRTSLDELPQLLNVLKGDLSLVGPRPYLMDQIEKLGEFAEKILPATPGLTGLWQVSGRNDILFEKRLALDTYYVENWSVRLELYVILKTPWIMITGRGAY
jgi:lipopolysaccharide/colanic/teichoic acid biosynthesis glycosyltransferase